MSIRPRRNTWLHSWDPRWKFAAFFLLVVSIAVERPDMRSEPIALIDLPPALAVLTLAIGLLKSAGFSLRETLHRVRGALWVFALLLVGFPFFFGSSATAFSLDGLTLGASIVTRSSAALLLIFPGFLTTAPDRALRTLRTFRVPPALILIFQFTHRYTAVFRKRQKRCTDAMALRGFQGKPTPRSLRIWGQQIGTALYYCIDRAEGVGAAMKLRGYSSKIAPLDDASTSSNDVLKFLLIVTAGAALLYWRLFGV